PPLFRGCVVVSNRSSAPRQGRGAASRRGSEGSAGQQPGQGRGSCPGGPQARGGGGRRGGGRRSGASGVVEQVGPAFEAGVDDPAIGDEAGQSIPQSLPPPAGQLGVLPAQVLDVGGEVEGDELGLLRRLTQQRLPVLVGAQA